MALTAVMFPYLPGAHLLDFVRLPLPMPLALIGIAAAYVTVTELLMRPSSLVREPSRSRRTRFA